MMLLSHKAGLRAKEISGLTWEMITDADGNIGDEITLRDGASKGSNGGHPIRQSGGLADAVSRAPLGKAAQLDDNRTAIAHNRR